MLAVLGLVPRLYVAIAWAKEPVWDGHYYHFGATRIAEGLGYSEDVTRAGAQVWSAWCHYPVGYSGFLGAFYAVFGSGLLVAPLVNALIGTLTVIVIHRLARHYLCAARAALAALLVALHPGLILYTALVMTEPLAALLAFGAGWCALQHRTHPRLGILGAGLLLGLGALVRPPALFAGPLLVWLLGGDLWAMLRRGAAVALVALAVIAPWTARNCLVMDGCAFISTNGGWNLAIGALTPTGRFTSLTAKDGCPVVTGQVQQDRCWADVGRREILAHPGKWVALMPEKLRHTYNHESFAVEYLGEADPASWPTSRREQTRAVLTTFHHLLMLLGFLGAVASTNPRDVLRGGAAARINALSQWGLLAAASYFILGAMESSPPPLYWLAVVAPVVAALHLPGAPPQGRLGVFFFGLLFVTTITHAIFFGDDRYHIVVSPVLCVLAAAALRRSAPGASRAPRAAPETRTS